jgi:uncharacterized delta-60 repeat protein
VLILAAACLAGCGSAAALFDVIEHLVIPSGSLDPSFGGGDGIVTTEVGTSWDEAYAMALQPDGKIVLAGRCSIGFAVVRYTPQGVLDTTFGSGGIVTTDVSGSSSHARGVAIQDDDKIVVVGTTSDATPSDIAVVRYLSNGQLDTTFSGDGIAVINPGADDEGRAVAIQTDGQIVVAGFCDGDFVVLRINKTDGSLDTTFGGTGSVRTDLGGTDYALTVAIQPVDQKIIAVGECASGGITFAAVRYLPNGTLDTSFDGDGKAFADVSSSVDESAKSVALQADGKILIAGHSHTATRFALARLNANGSLDTSFGSSGFAITEYEDSSQGEAVAVQSDGKIVLAGSTYNGADGLAAAVRYLSDGSLDTSFGISSAGISTFGIGVGDLYGKAVAIQDDGRILIGGYASSGNNFALARLLP